MADLSNLGRYQLRRVLGKGAMGVVYEGFDPSLKRAVAIKTILKNVVTDEETAAAYSLRFAREARAAGRLSHPHIVQVYDFGEENDVAYLAMEYIQGRELRSFFEARQRFDSAEAVRIMGELLNALDFAHQAGVIHRDIKPANIMLDEQRRVKLADFGVARIQDGTDRSKSGAIVGTPAYMSPEQITGGRLDARTDIFSAGIVLYQLLTNEQPFKGAGAWTVAKQIMQDEPPRPSTVATRLSPAFDQIVNRALAKKPDQRYATAKDFAAALNGALTGESTQRGSEAEIEFWRSIQGSVDPAEYEVYLKEFPTGIYADLARVKIAKLPQSAPVMSSVNPMPSPPLPVRDAEDVSKLAEETAELEAELARREAEYRQRETEQEAKRQAEAKARAAAEAKREAELARREAEARDRATTVERARIEAIEKARREAEAELARKETEFRKRETEALARADAEAKARRELEEKAKKQADLRAKAEAEARARRETEDKLRRDADAKARAEADARARTESEQLARHKAEIQRREAEIQRTEAELKRRAAEAPSKSPVVPVALGGLLVTAGLLGAYYWSASSDEARLAQVTAALEVATRATQELNVARQRQEELRKQVDVARLAEDAARSKGDQAKLKELQEQTKRAEAEAQKQNELVKQREAAAKKADGAARTADAGKQADAAKVAEKLAQEKAAADKLAAEKVAIEKAVSEKEAAEKVAVARAAADRAIAEKAAADKAAADKLAAAKIAAAPAVSTAPSASTTSSDSLFKQATTLESEGKVPDAVRIYIQAARVGSGQAAKRLGEIYNNGAPGVPPDSAESTKWYTLARARGVDVGPASKR